jgi:hypothetical protein
MSYLTRETAENDDPQNDPELSAPKDFSAYLADAPEDVRSLVEALVEMPKDAAPTFDRLAAQFGWSDSRLWLAVSFATHSEFIEIWEATDREPAVMLNPFSAWMNELELTPNDGGDIPDKFAWRPLDTPPGPVKLKARLYEVRASALDRNDPKGMLANLSDESNAPNARSAICDLADVNEVTLYPADMNGVDRTVLSPLPPGAYAADLVIAWEAKKISAAEFAGRIRRHARPVGMSRAWSARDEDRAPDAHKNDPAGDPRGAITMDSPRLARYDRYGPAKKAEMFAKLQAEERIGRVDPSRCPACRDAKLGYSECCPLCHRYGADRLVGREERPAPPDDSGVAERNRLNKRFGRVLQAIRREDNPPDEEKARGRAARAGKRRQRLAIEASRTRKVRGRPPKSG